VDLEEKKFRIKITLISYEISKISLLRQRIIPNKKLIKKIFLSIKIS